MNTKLNSIVLDLYIPKDEWMRLYRGETRWVHATSRDGRSIQFPANILTPYTTHNGVSGTFVITFDEDGKFQHIERY